MAADDDAAEVTIVNGPKRRRRRGKGKRSSMAKRRRRRRRRRNPGENPENPRHRRRRRRNPTRTRRAYRRIRAGFRGGMRVDFRDDLKWGLHRLAGKAIAAWAVMRWGDKPAANPGGPSPTSGDRWSLKNVIIALVSAYIGGEIGARFLRINGQQVYNGGVDLALTKVFWSEIVGRIPGGRAALGRHQRERMGQLPAGSEGDIMQDDTGTQWIHKEGRWQSMMGLEQARAVDGYGELETARALDGDLETARALDGYTQRMLQEGRMGHYMDPGATSPGASAEGAYLRRGSADAFHAAYL